MPRPWLLAETTYHDVQQRPPEVAVLPFGATEPHNLHLPYATDSIESELIGEAACRLAYEQGARVVCLPTVPYGVETNLAGFPFAMNLMPSTLHLVVRDLVASLERSGVRKCLILNSHGGNAFKGTLRELYGGGVRLFLCNWYTIRDRYDEIFERRDDHAGEMETSLLLHARPDLVHLDRADPGATRPMRFEALREGWVEITRPWRLLTTNSGSGDPRKASAEKGRRWIEILAQRLAQFLVELDRSPLDDLFPFESEPSGPASSGKQTP